MSRLNFENLSGLPPIELGTAATVPPASQGGRAGSFEQHLDQARQTVEGRTGAEQPSPADRRSDAERRQAAQEAPSAAEPQADTAQAAPGSRQDDPSTSDPSPSDSDGQGNVDDAQSDGPQAEGVSDADEAPDQESEPDDGQLAVGSPPVADALAVIASAKPSDQEDVAKASVVSEEETVASEGQSQAERPTQQTTFSDTTGEVVPGEMEQGDAEAAPLEDATAGAEADGKEGTQVDEEGFARDRIAQQSQGPTEGEQDSDDAASERTGSPAADPTDRSSEVREAAADSRRNSGRHHGGPPLTESPGDNPLGQSVEGVASEATQQASSMISQTEAPNDIKSEGGGTPSAVSTATDTGGGETAVPTRVVSNQSIRQSSGSAQGESGTDQVDRVRFVQRVARAFAVVGDRGGSVRLRLHPPELGALRLDVTVRNGTMTARLEVETNAARTMLLDNLPELRDRLAAQEIKVGRFDVDLSDRSSGGTPQGPGDHPQPHDHPGRGSPNPGPEQEIEAEGPPQPRAVGQPGQGSQLDVVI